MPAVGRSAATALVFLAALSAAALAQSVTIELLQGPFNPTMADQLDGLICRNEDRIVHIDLIVDWPEQMMAVESYGAKGLTLWTKSTGATNYSFPKGSYTNIRGNYAVKGYFIVRFAGTGQGAVEYYFEKMPDTTILLNPYVAEKRTASADCGKRNAPASRARSHT